ncbi:jg18365 [Pararge aegeria aegeria]|uniref:Jg18365 protein n=3 Tax=cellular organisms TaxID=131567 RepID=A0A8S4RIX2_9NEOP|nr:jg18365 [Pararge aegeria aegeria]
MIHIAAKIAIIVTAAAVTYALLSLLNKARPKSVKTDDMSEDEGYSSVDEGEEKDTVKEPKRTETELEEELKNKRAEEEMKNGLPKHMDFKGNSLSKSADTTDSHFVSSATNIVMEPLPKHMDALGNPLPEQPPSNLTNIGLGSSKSTQKLSAADLLLQYGNVNNDVRKVLEWPITSKEFNGLGFNR